MSQSAGVSRPSMANCADRENQPESGSTDETGDREIQAAIRGIIQDLEAEYAELAKRALSAVPGDRLRREATREIRSGEGTYKSRVVRSVLRAFLRWLSDVEDMQIVFNDPSGEQVAAPLEHAYSEEYLAEKYGKIKDGERAAVEEAEKLHTAMLTLSGSNLNSREDPRCPGDHLRDLKESFHRFVRRELQRVMDSAGFDRYDPEAPPEKWWEYAVVVEPHKSGYAHMHIAVFASHEIGAGMFEPVMEKHVEKCEMAGSDAHEVHPGHPSDSAVSVKSVDPSKEYDPEEDMEDITNLGTYIADYIGASGEDLWDRPVSELVCFSLLWATETRRIHFSQGFHDLADVGMELRGEDPDAEAHGWTLEGIQDGEDGEIHEVHVGKVCDGCNFRETGLESEECPECGHELRSTATDYTVEIEGMAGGDPPISRG